MLTDKFTLPYLIVLNRIKYIKYSFLDQIEGTIITPNRYNWRFGIFENMLKAQININRQLQSKYEELYGNKFV